MSDLISRAELLNRLAACQDKAEIFAVIQAAPDVDVVPVRNGRWIECRGVMIPFAKCSACGTRQEVDMNFNYCPFCGANMGLEVTYGQLL